MPLRSSAQRSSTAARTRSAASSGRGSRSTRARAVARGRVGLATAKAGADIRTASRRSRRARSCRSTAALRCRTAGCHPSAGRPAPCPVTLKSLETATWTSPLDVITCATYEPSGSCMMRSTSPGYLAVAAAATLSAVSPRHGVTEARRHLAAALRGRPALGHSGRTLRRRGRARARAGRAEQPRPGRQHGGRAARRGDLREVLGGSHAVTIGPRADGSVGGTWDLPERAALRLLPAKAQVLFAVVPESAGHGRRSPLLAHEPRSGRGLPPVREPRRGDRASRWARASPAPAAPTCVSCTRRSRSPRSSRSACTRSRCSSTPTCTRAWPTSRSRSRTRTSAGGWPRGSPAAGSC